MTEQDVQKGRLTVAESIYHQLPGKQPVALGEPFSKRLSSAHRPYQYAIILTEEWKQVDGGWLIDCSLLHVANDEGKLMQRVPTIAEQEEINSRIIQVSIESSKPWLVAPGETFRGCPSSLADVKVRCGKGTARCTITVIPS